MSTIETEERCAGDAGQRRGSAGQRAAGHREIRVQGKFFFAGERKHFVKGVTYGPFARAATARSSPSARWSTRDFALMREAGDQHRPGVHRAAALAARRRRAGRAEGAGRAALVAAHRLSRQRRRSRRRSARRSPAECAPAAVTRRSSPIWSATRSRPTWSAGTAPKPVRRFLEGAWSPGAQGRASRGAGQLRQLSLDRISDRRFHRFRLLQRLSARRDRVPPLHRAAAQSRGRPAAGADRVRRRFVARGRGGAAPHPVLAGAHRLRSPGSPAPLSSPGPTSGSPAAI